MSEFGSYKSFSSVSESSASHSSQPPDSSSSHSSGEPSSSSDEVHTCHRCGNCCFSDKSRITFTKPALPPEFADDNEFSVPLWDSLPETIEFTSETTGIIRWYGAYSDTITFSGQQYRLNARATRSCPEGTFHLDVWVETRVDEEDGWGDSERFFTLRGMVSTSCCHTTYGEHRFYDIEEHTYEGEVTLQLENNPCCRDPITDACWQHLNGDCRGDCDEEPSSSGSIESSEENPLP